MNAHCACPCHLPRFSSVCEYTAALSPSRSRHPEAPMSLAESAAVAGAQPLQARRCAQSRYLFCGTCRLRCSKRWKDTRLGQSARLAAAPKLSRILSYPAWCTPPKALPRGMKRPRLPKSPSNLPRTRPRPRKPSWKDALPCSTLSRCSLALLTGRAGARVLALRHPLASCQGVPEVTAPLDRQVRCPQRPGSILCSPCKVHALCTLPPSLWTTVKSANNYH